MPMVSLTMNRDLTQVAGAGSAEFDQIHVPIADGESILDLLLSYGSVNEIFSKAVFDGGSKMIRMNISIVMNGHIVNPYSRETPTLKDGDEVTIISMVEGG